MLGQGIAIQSQELRDVYDRVSGQARRTRRQQDIRRGFRQFDVARDRSYDCGLNPAAIERAGLDNKNGPPVSGLGTAWRGRTCPPDLPSLNLGHVYQSSLASDFRWARCKPESSFAARPEYTWFRRSVIEFSCCPFRNSAIALAYSSLLETRRRRAVASAMRKSSSGNETAVFIPVYNPRYTEALFIANPHGRVFARMLRSTSEF